MAPIKLNSFCIRNYRSIVNSGWKTLASDNITVLIGQNESGKTSVLEALYAFYTGSLSEDVLRSDNTFPVVSCSFKIEESKKVADFLIKSRIPANLLEIINNDQEFVLTREWDKEKNSKIFVATENIAGYFNTIETIEKNLFEKTETEIQNNIIRSETLFNSLSELEKQCTNISHELLGLRKTIAEKERLLKKSKQTDARQFIEIELKDIKNQYNELESLYTKRQAELNEKAGLSRKVSEKLSAGHRLKQLEESYIQELEKCTENKNKLVDLEHLYELSSNEKEKRIVFNDLQKVRNDIDLSREVLAKLETDKYRALRISAKFMLDNITLVEAETLANKEINNEKYYYNKFEIGEELFKHIPVFVFFEDFSGLLPNKIDLEDILGNNYHIEGYKAALNFLKISGLDISFFREKNHRILKQKIESLNSDVTLNFQDYWTQFIGRNNKIRLHFELEHYDYTVPGKSGKPYLEFWIKDNQERLYPKQRSRGVRWFISFYLELKAAAADTGCNRVLLIDEPGLSLHARAQEDVLKVFEDLKQTMQIVYSTHSPHLVKTDKLYRILAVQRVNANDDKSETLIYDPTKIGEASADTLSPVYSLLGIKLADQQIIKAKHNIIVPDIIAYYYLCWLNKIIPQPLELSFIPATGADSVGLLINILTSWQIKYGVLLFESDNALLAEKIHLPGEKVFSGAPVLCLNNFDSPEDLFSVLDFKKYIYQQRTGITEKISEFIINNSLSRKILATNFVNNINEGKVVFSNFDETTKENINMLFLHIKELL
ncbi:MAG: AAA family ATPase [Bacteroidales bacterium]|nr:AAA family ATPase [Bacteroidales bacterium]